MHRNLQNNNFFQQVVWTKPILQVSKIKLSQIAKTLLNITSIFRKVTFSKVFTNYDSFIFDTYKIGLVHTLLFRFFKIYSGMGNFHIEVEHLRSIFKCNKYPVNIIDQCIKKLFDGLYALKEMVPTVPKLLVVLSILGKSCLNLRKLLYKLVSKSLPQSNIKVIFQSKNQLSSLQ